jgi:hypothetical protein
VAVDSIGHRTVDVVAAVEEEVGEGEADIMGGLAEEEDMRLVVEVVGARDQGIGIMMRRELGERKRMMPVCTMRIEVNGLCNSSIEGSEARSVRFTNFICT